MAEDGRPVSVSIVEGRDAAVVASDRVREWVAVNMADLLPDPPEVAMDEMLVDAAVHDAPRSTMQCRSRTCLGGTCRTTPWTKRGATSTVDA